MKADNRPNPFSTCFVQPGSIDYQRADGGTLEQLVEVLLGRHGGWGAIIGPHGTGKSTLVASLRPLLQQRRRVFAYRLSTSDRSFAALTNDRSKWDADSLIIVDGYEQLSSWSAWRLRRWASGLLVTAHRPMFGLPVLWRTGIDEEQAIRLRNDLLRNHSWLQSRPDLETAWRSARANHPTDLRETLFAMYDWVEACRRSAAEGSVDSDGLV